MFNILRKDLPLQVTLKAKVYDIDYRFNNILNILACWEDELFPKEDRIKMMLHMFYVQDFPEEESLELFEKMVNFISLGEEVSSSSSSSPYEKIIDYEIDSWAIYSFFARVYKIDLQKEKIHWYRFVVLCQDLDESSNLANIVRIRTTSLNEVAKENRGKLAKLKRKFNLVKEPQTLEERNRLWLMEK